MSVSLDEIIKVAAPTLQALSIAATAIFAVLGLSAWRRQLVGKRRLEIAEEILVATYRIQGDLAHVRNPLVYGDEGQSRPRLAQEMDRAAPVKDNYFVPLERMKKLDDDFAHFQKARLLAQAYFGPEAAQPFDAIMRVYRDVAVAAHMLVTTAGESRRDVGLETVSAWETTIWQISPDDKFVQAVSHAVTEIEALCRPALTA
jgi:hypothetical protein